VSRERYLEDLVRTLREEIQDLRIERACAIAFGLGVVLVFIVHQVLAH
jgi:hypothetical protein